MATIDDLARAIIDQEGSEKPGSVGYTINQKYGMWNLGHLVWAKQTGAIAVTTVTGGREWAAWPTRQAAYDGLLRQIRLDAGRGLTLAQFIAKYAPVTENDTSAYLRFVASRLNVATSTPLADIVRGAPANPTPVPPVRLNPEGPTPQESPVPAPTPSDPPPTPPTSGGESSPPSLNQPPGSPAPLEQPSPRPWWRRLLEWWLSS